MAAEEVMTSSLRTGSLLGALQIVFTCHSNCGIVVNKAARNLARKWLACTYLKFPMLSLNRLLIIKANEMHYFSNLF
jgi:hypothetical protein